MDTLKLRLVRKLILRILELEELESSLTPDLVMSLKALMQMNSLPT